MFVYIKKKRVCGSTWERGKHKHKFNEMRTTDRRFVCSCHYFEWDKSADHFCRSHAIEYSITCKVAERIDIKFWSTKGWSNWTVRSANDKLSLTDAKHESKCPVLMRRRRRELISVVRWRLVVFANSGETDFPNIARAVRLLRRDFLEK